MYFTKKELLFISGYAKVNASRNDISSVKQTEERSLQVHFSNILSIYNENVFLFSGLYRLYFNV